MPPHDVGTVHRYGSIVSIRGVATEDAVLAEQPEVSGLGGGFVRERRDLVWVGQPAGVGERVEQLLQVAVVEAEEVEVRAGDSELDGNVTFVA